MKGRKTSRVRLEEAGYSQGAVSTVRYGNPETLPPEAVADDPTACECWERVVRSLIDVGRWQPTDRHLVQRLAVAYSLCSQLEPQLLAGKTIQKTKTGYQAVSAPLTCWKTASAEMGRLEKALGITPSERASQKVVARDQDELTEWLAEHE